MNRYRDLINGYGLEWSAAEDKFGLTNKDIFIC